MRIRYIIALCLTVAASLASYAAEPLRLDVSQCREMALKASEQMRGAENSRRIASLETKAATTNYLPKIDAMATGTYMFQDMDMMGATLQMHGMYVAGFQLTQPVYAGGKITAGRSLAKIGERVAAEQQRMTRLDVVADVETAYWNYVSVLGKVALMESYMNLMDTLMSHTELAVEVGMTVRNDLLRVEARRSEIVYQRQKVANGANLCRMALCEAIGVDYDTEIIPLDSDASGAPSPADVLDATPADRPELRLLEEQVEAKRQMVKLTRGDFLPTVGLSVGYNWYGNIKLNTVVEVAPEMYVPYSQSFNDKLGMAMIAVKVPLFHWGEGVRKVQKAKLEVENARLELERNSRLLNLETRQAEINVEDGFSMISSATLALEQAAENLRVTTERHRERVCPLTDLLDAQAQWQQASANLIEARAQYRIYLVAYLKATARL